MQGSWQHVQNNEAVLTHILIICVPVPSGKPVVAPFGKPCQLALRYVQGVNAVVFSGFGCAHRVLADQGKVPVLPGIDEAYNGLLTAVRDRA